MSCVIGLVTDNGVIMGTESLASDGNLTIPITYPKLHTASIGSRKIGIGAAGSIRLSPILDYYLEVPKFGGSRDDDLNPTKYVVTQFLPALRAAFDKASYKMEEGSEILIGLLDRVYMIDNEFGVAESSLRYDVIGSSREVALGSLYTSGRLGFEPIDRVHTALNAVSELTAFSGGKSHIEHIPMWSS